VNHLTNCRLPGHIHHDKNSERISWQALITEDIENNDDKILKEFLAVFGRFPGWNASTVGTTTQ
jgi:hypothetical protein